MNNRLLTKVAPYLLLAVSICGSVYADTPVFTQTDPEDGSVVFSDAPMVDGEIVRTSYQAEYGRPVAQASCEGLTATAMAERAAPLDKTIELAAKTHKVDANLIRAIAEVESCFDIQAVSRVGAQGVMQLMPATALELGVSDSFDASQNINGGVSYIAKMLGRFNYDHRLALAAYNAGPGAVDKYNGVPPFPETQQYVEKVMGIYGQKVAQQP